MNKFAQFLTTNKNVIITVSYVTLCAAGVAAYAAGGIAYVRFVNREAKASAVIAYGESIIKGEVSRAVEAAESARKVREMLGLEPVVEEVEDEDE
jgi:hypothetical protein